MVEARGVKTVCLINALLILVNVIVTNKQICRQMKIMICFDKYPSLFKRVNSFMSFSIPFKTCEDTSC